MKDMQLVTGHQWFDLLLKFVAKRTADGIGLAAFPDGAIQVQFAGPSKAVPGRREVRFCQAPKAHFVAIGSPSHRTTRALGFGCGMGRWLRIGRNRQRDRDARCGNTLATASTCLLDNVCTNDY